MGFSTSKHSVWFIRGTPSLELSNQCLIVYIVQFLTPLHKPEREECAKMELKSSPATRLTRQLVAVGPTGDTDSEDELFQTKTI